MNPTAATTKEQLAIHGGTPVRTKPWLENETKGAEEKDAVNRVMDSGHLSLFQGAYKPNPPYNFLGGPEVQALESLAQSKTGAKHMVAINSATSGLNAAVGALELGFGDEVIVSPYTMSACAVAPLWYGAVPIFADVELETGCLSPQSIREKITPRTKGIIVIHQFGIPAKMDEIMEIAREHDLKVIEDCAQAWDAKYKGQPVGTIGDIGVFSFNVHKTIECGEGGLCSTNDDELALRLQMIRNHGEAITEDAEYEEITNIIGQNYRMTELQAAVASEQLRKLDALNTHRISMVNCLNENLKKHDCLITPDFGHNRSATYYVYPLRYIAEKCGDVPREKFAAALKAEGIDFMEGYVKPLYLLPLFQKKNAFKNGYPWAAPENQESQTNYEKGACPNAEQLREKEMLINLFVCPPQTKEDMEDICEAMEKVVKNVA